MQTAAALLPGTSSLLAAAGLAVGISLLAFLLAGARLRQHARRGLLPGLRPRRQWLVSGLGITLAFVLPAVLFGGPNPSVRAVVALAALSGMVGLANDLFRLPRYALLLLSVAIAVTGVKLGLLIAEVKPPFTQHFVALGMWSGPLTVLWLMVVAYAVIMLRRVPGLTARVIVIISLVFGATAALAAPPPGLIAVFLACVLAAAIIVPGWRRDFPDLGSGAHWAMGFALAGITVVGMLKNTAFLVLGVPLLVLGVPVGEVTYAAVYAMGKGRRRIEFRQRWELPHEALMRRGISPARVLLLFQLATTYLCLLALLLALLLEVSFLVKTVLLALGLGGGGVVFFLLVRLWSAPQETGADTVDMFGVPLTRLDMEGALTRVEQFIADRSPHLIITSDTPGIVRAHDDLEYQELIRSAAMVTADGRGVVWMARILGLPMQDRVSGVDLVLRICQRAVERSYSVFLLGAAPGVAGEAAQTLQARCPGLRVAGTQHGYFTPEEEPAIVQRIADLRPEVLFVAMGAPKQEQWIRRHADALQVPVAIGVGGSFDVFAGRAPRAPEWMQRAGLEWLYRSLREPKRLPRLWALPRLLWMTLWEALRRR